MHSRDKSKSQSFKDADSTFCATSFVVGQHVVCIADIMGHPQAGDMMRFYGGKVTWPRVNVVYTIRAVGISISGAIPVLRLVEIVNEPRFYKGKLREPAFPVNYFRPLQKLKLEDFMPIVEHLTDEVRA